MRVLFTAPNEHLRHLRRDYPELTVYWWDRLMDPPYAEAEAWVCNPSRNTVISDQHLANIPNLKYLATPSTGTNHIDFEACKRRKIEVLSLLDDRQGLAEIRASSEFTFQLILHALHRPFQQFGAYKRDDDIMRGHELYGKKVGIIGHGRIGRNIARWVKAFGATFLPYDLYSSEKFLMRIFKECDVVLISATLTEQTKGMITSDYLHAMKPGAILVNTARAEIINEDDLNGWCAHGRNVFATDVLHGEVTGEHVNSPLLDMGNVIVTPHIAGTTYESQEKAARIVLDLLANLAKKGRMESVVGVQVTM